MRQSQCKALVATLIAAFPRAEVTQTTVNVYVEDLSDLDFDAASRAIAALRKGSVFFPSIAEIRTFYAEVKLGAPSATSAWEQAAGHGDRHPLVIRARRIVGDDWHWRGAPAGVLRKAFMEAYIDVKAEAVRLLAQPELAPSAAGELEAAVVPELPLKTIA